MHSRRLRVTLVFPRFKYISGDPPLGIAYISAYLKKNLPDVEVSIIDTTFDRSLEMVRKSMEDISPDIVGIYLDTLMYMDGIRIARMARENGAFVIAGGPHATMAPESVINYADLVILGEGEKTLTRIVETFPDIEIESLKGVVCKRNGMMNFENKELDLIEDIDTIPIPDRELLDMDKYTHAWDYLDCVKIGTRGTTMITSRGCPFLSTFYQTTLEGLFGKKLRLRSPENVVEEVCYLKDKHDIKGLFFHDDTFTVNRNWVLKFCELVEDKNISILWGCNISVDTVDERLLKRMFEVGLRSIHLYVATGVQDIPNNVHDGGKMPAEIQRVTDIANRLHIYVHGFFTLGARDEIEEEIKDAIRYANLLGLKDATFSVITPMPETQPPKHPFSESRIKILRRKTFFSFYMHLFRWKDIARHMVSPEGIKRLRRKENRFIQ